MATKKTGLVEEVELNTEETAVKAKPKKKFTRGDYILCHSVTSGGLNICCKSGNTYEFKKYGDTCEIEYGDLCALVRKSSSHITNPRFVIDDEDFVSEFPQLGRIYAEMYTNEDLLTILTLSDSQMRREIDKLPVDTKNTLKNLVASEIARGRLDSIRKVRILTEVFNSDFNLLSELFVR